MLAELVKLVLQTLYDLGIVGGHQVGNKDGDVNLLAARVLLCQLDGSEQGAPRIREVVDDEDVVLVWCELARLLLLHPVLVVEELLLLPDGFANSCLLDVQDVIKIQDQLRLHRFSVAVVGAVVGKEDVRVILPWICRLGFELLKEVRHEALHPDRGPQVANRPRHRSFLVKLHEKQLQRWAPQGVDGHPVHGGIGARERGH
mmetsp:Transcript_3230/g.7622  ORF Transcript_3230/g.7622 Transcript_3230/m.7622 type:complete len:202 (-) Transcript_3230:795-1400(-)